jgi:hypothetical protein
MVHWVLLLVQPYMLKMKVEWKHNFGECSYQFSCRYIVLGLLQLNYNIRENKTFWSRNAQNNLKAIPVVEEHVNMYKPVSIRVSRPRLQIQTSLNI